jgi:hypothetical protein
VRLKLVTLAALALIGCGGAAAGAQEHLSAKDAAKLPRDGELWGLCPVPDAPQDFRDRVAKKARQRARALIREVRRRPRALVTIEYEDSHTGEPFTETTTVKELAEMHLKNPGLKGVPCARRIMSELKAAVAGKPAPKGVKNDKLHTYDELVRKLHLRKDGAVFWSPDGCQVQNLYFDRGEVKLAREEPIANNVVVASPDRSAGVEIFKPDARCLQGIKEDLKTIG